MKHASSILAIAALLNSSFSILHSTFAAVPIRWTVETTRATPAAFEGYQGETIDFEAALNAAGKPLAIAGEAALYWQTNGMGAAYWSAPASVTGNVLRATWTPACDVGARAYNCFIGVPGAIYRAAFQLRLRPSPGATPNALPLPPRVIDFAAVTVLNPPWPMQADLESVSNTVAAWEHYWDGDDVRFTVTNYYGSVDAPALYIEQKMDADNTHTGSWFKTVWDERTRLAPITTRLTQAESAVATLDAAKADNGTWGYYDSHNGTVAPDGFVSISGRGVILGNGQTWQKTIVAEGSEVWTLVGSANIVPGTNSTLRLEDTDGTTVFEIIKGGRVDRGATAAAIAVGDTAQITYTLSDAAGNPTIQYCTNLVEQAWTELTADTSSAPHVAWSNAGEVYTATITLPTPKPPAMFFKARYEAGEDGYVRFHSPVDATPGLYVQTANGRKKIVPRITGTTVTWEVAQ